MRLNGGPSRASDGLARLFLCRPLAGLRRRPGGRFIDRRPGGRLLDRRPGWRLKHGEGEDAFFALASGPGLINGVEHFHSTLVLERE